MNGTDLDRFSRQELCRLFGGIGGAGVVVFDFVETRCKYMSYMIRTALIIVFAGIDSSSALPYNSVMFPDVLNLNVTVQREYNGEIKEGYHVGTLSCTSADCSFIWLSLNQCWGDSFYPKMERFTLGKNLTVTAIQDTVIVRITTAEYSSILKMVLHDEEKFRSQGVLKNFDGYYSQK